MWSPWGRLPGKSGSASGYGVIDVADHPAPLEAKASPTVLPDVGSPLGLTMAFDLTTCPRVNGYEI